MKNIGLKILDRLGIKRFSFALQILNRYFILENQRELIKACHKNELVLLSPRPPFREGGNVEHYYHFIFDLLLPLSRLLKRTPPGFVFMMKEFGPFTERLEQIFSGKVKIVNDQELPASTITLPLIGMNPTVVYVKNDELNTFRQEIFEKFDIEVNTVNKALLIERLPPSDYFKKKATYKGSGSSRRSILNHSDLYKALPSLLSDSVVIENLQLERLSFVEQIQKFYDSKVLIAQHGAALANAIWMQPGSIVIELGYDDKSHEHFRIISKLSEHNYFVYYVEDAHTNIDIQHFSDWFITQPVLSNLLIRD